MNHLDLFSGIGGFALGIEQAGIEHGWLGFSEIDKYANKVYKRRFPDAEELGSVENVSFKELKGRRIDLLTGGFPCQAFSVAGLRGGFSDTRGTMFFEIARILKDYIENGKPIPCILLENLKGLLFHNSRQTFATIYKVLTDLNYTIECELFNTKWWLPQARQRIFIFGRYNGNPSGRKVFPIRESNEKDRKTQEKSHYTPRNTRTITTAHAHGTSTNMSYIKEGKRIRRLTPKEVSRLQGFPDDWNDCCSDTQRYKQMGNAVSVPVIKAIVERIITISIRNKYDEEL